jgi:predicted amidophosphoribosyltransferase
MEAIITRTDALLTDLVDRSRPAGGLSEGLPTVSAMLLACSCALCSRPGPVVCGACAQDLRRAPSLPTPLGLDACHAALDYRPARHLVTALKNGDHRDLVGWLADQMSDLVDPPAGAAVTWAPTGAARRRARGYDQAELLARALARRWDRPCRSLLRRQPGPAQSGRTAGERWANPVFDPVGRVAPAVVLVDDVATTGATLTAAARALRAAGAHRIVAVVGARAAPARAA